MHLIQLNQKKFSYSSLPLLYFPISLRIYWNFVHFRILKSKLKKEENVRKWGKSLICFQTHSQKWASMSMYKKRSFKECVEMHEEMSNIIHTPTVMEFKWQNYSNENGNKSKSTVEHWNVSFFCRRHHHHQP